jgi:molecular chaperone GrpE (heat shock protein)
MNDNITNDKKKVSIKEEVFSEKSKEIEKEKIDEEKEKLEKEISSLREKNLLLLANNENQREKYRKEFEQNLLYNKKRIIL